MAHVDLPGRTHYGRLLRELVAEDPGYCQWVMQAAQDRDGSSTGRTPVPTSVISLRSCYAEYSTTNVQI